jgi:hypothetical protein
MGHEIKVIYTTQKTVCFFTTSLLLCYISNGLGCDEVEVGCDYANRVITISNDNNSSKY